MPWFVIDAIFYGVSIAAFVGLLRFMRAEEPKQPPRQYLGVDCWVRTSTGSRSRTINTKVMVRAQGAPEFTLRHERWYDRFAKALGLSVEFQTHQPQFDDAVYILCDDPAVHRWLELDASSRADLTALLEAKPLDRTRILSVSCDGVMLSVESHSPANTSFQGKKARADVVGEEVAKAVVERAKQIADRLTRIAVPSAGGMDTRDGYASRSRKLIAAALGFVAGSVVVSFLPWPQAFEFSPDGLTGPAFPAGLGVVIAGALGTFIVLRGSSRVHGTLALVVAILAFGAFWGAPQVMKHLNQELDRSAPVEYAVTVASHSRQGGKSKNYYLTVQGPVAGDINTDDPFYPRAELHVRPATYDSISDGDTVRLQLHQGYFGVPWLSTP